MSYATILAGFASFFYADSCRRFDFWLIRSPFRDHSGHFRSIWGHLRLNFSILDLHFFDFSKSVRNRPENTPKPSPNHPQTIPNPSQIFSIFSMFWSGNFGFFFDWFFNGFLMDFLFWGGPGVSFLGCGSCMEPTPGPGGALPYLTSNLTKKSLINQHLSL